MLKQVALGVAAIVAFVAPARADLHYTIHSEARQVTPADPVNPIFGMAGDMVIRTMFPEGPTDTTYWVSDKGVRVELTKATSLAPAGAVLLQLADGTMLVLNPKDHTYWKLNLQAMTPTILTAITRLNPQAAIVHTGEFDTIAGVRAEHITSTMTMELPLPPGTPLPPGIPTSVATTTDSWSSDQYASYAALAKSTANTMGLGAMIPEGFVLKNVVRSSMIPGLEIESVVTRISEEPAPDDAFAIPADYKEVGPPPADVYRPGNGVTPPRLLREVKPQYTAQAMRARIEGSVSLACVVGIDGSVTDVKVVRSLDATYGLDDEAIKAAKQWQFAPGMKDNVPVRVQVTIEIAFRLRADPTPNKPAAPPAQ